MGSTFKCSINPGDLSQTNLTTVGRTIEDLRSEFIFPERNCLQGLQVLLIEDSLDNQLLIARFLNVVGAVVEFADNGLEGLEKALQKDYDLILMDLQMPVMDGYTAIAGIRNKRKKTPIIALTARAMKEERDRCLALGFTDHIAKPVERKELIGKITEYSRKLGFDHDRKYPNIGKSTGQAAGSSLQ